MSCNVCSATNVKWEQMQLFCDSGSMTWNALEERWYKKKIGGNLNAIFGQLMQEVKTKFLKPCWLYITCPSANKWKKEQIFLLGLRNGQIILRGMWTQTKVVGLGDNHYYLVSLVLLLTNKIQEAKIASFVVVLPSIHFKKEKRNFEL